jgi:hypothetical protein
MKRQLDENGISIAYKEGERGGGDGTTDGIDAGTEYTPREKTAPTIRIREVVNSKRMARGAEGGEDHEGEKEEKKDGGKEDTRKKAHKLRLTHRPTLDKMESMKSITDMPEQDGKNPKSGGKLVFDDWLYRCCWCCIPLCFPNQPRSQVFRERALKELRSKKLELHLHDHNMVVNVAPDYQPSYWSDLFYYIFQTDYFLACLYCDHEHPFNKTERTKVYFTMISAVFLFATTCRPPTNCEDWIDPTRPGYARMHTWGRSDCGWTFLCENGFTPPDANLVAILSSGVLKHSYGELLEFMAFCPCFIDYVGTFKDRTECVGAAFLNFAVAIAFVQLYIACKVIYHSPFQSQMIGAAMTSILVGILTGWLICWCCYHYFRSRQTSCQETTRKCGQGVDQDGDGIECMEVIRTMQLAFNSQKDTKDYDDPDDKFTPQQELDKPHEWQHEKTASKLILV